MQVVRHKRITVQGALKNPKAKGSMASARKLAIGLAFAHLKYLIHRPGEDRPEGGRRVFNELEDDVDPKQIRQGLMKMQTKSTINHKLMLSPEVSPSDTTAYTREVMHRLAQEKGQDLIWWAVPHKNTDQHHPHLIVLPVDRRGKRVTLSTEDYNLLKRFGDEYIQRVHPQEYLAAEQARQDKRERLVQERRANDEAARNERIDQGLELPWLHRKIVREQLEPFEHWKQQQWLNDFASTDTISADASSTAQQKSKRLEQIQVDGKVWTNEHSLAELQQLDKFLWRNKDKWIDVDEYKKLVRWIAVKEEEANLVPQQPADQVQQKPESSNQDTTRQTATTKSHSPVKKLPFQTIEVDGKEFNSQQSLDELKQLDAFLWKNRDKWVEKSEYKKLVRWIGVKEQEAPPLAEPPKTTDQEPVPPSQAEDSTKQTVSKKVETPTKRLPLQTIEADGKQWTSQQSLDELKQLDAFLWKNRDKWIEKSEYKKLVRWIAVKEEQAEQTANQSPAQTKTTKKLNQPEEKAQGKTVSAAASSGDPSTVAPEPSVPTRKDATRGDDRANPPAPVKSHPVKRFNEQGQVHIDGQTFNRETSYEVLSAAVSDLREDKDKRARLAEGQYKQLKQLLEYKDRERFSGVIARELDYAKKQYRQRRTDELSKINTRRYVNPLQQRVMSNPGMGLFMTAASLSSELVRSIPLKDTSDPIKKSKDEMYDARNDVLSKRRRRHSADERERDDATIERIDQGIDLVEQAEEERRRERKRPRPRRTNEDYYKQ